MDTRREKVVKYSVARCLHARFLHQIRVNIWPLSHVVYLFNNIIGIFKSLTGCQFIDVVLNIWFKNNILLMTQLLNENGLLYTYTEFLKEYGIPVTPEDFSIVFDAIPSGLLRLLPRKDTYDAIPLFKLDLLKLDGICITDKKFINHFRRKLCRRPPIPHAQSFLNSQYDNIKWR